MTLAIGEIWEPLEYHIIKSKEMVQFCKMLASLQKIDLFMEAAIDTSPGGGLGEKAVEPAPLHYTLM